MDIKPTSRSIRSSVFRHIAMRASGIPVIAATAAIPGADRPPGSLRTSKPSGLAWHENAPQFEAMAIDARWFPVRIIAPDPRAFVLHRHWLSERPDRRRLKPGRDAAQARWVAAPVAIYLPNLPFDPEMLKNLPRASSNRRSCSSACPGGADQPFGI